MVNIATWNIRGFNTLIKQVEVQNLLHDNKVSVFGLLETKVKEANCEKTVKRIVDRQFFSNYQQAYNGRIWVLWDPRVVLVELCSQSDQFIHTKITILSSGQQFWYTFVYAWNNPTERILMWQDMHNLAASIQEPWALLGDFNSCLRYDERWQDGKIVYTDTSELDTFTTTFGISDLIYSGIQLTWCNKREGSERMYSKLDR